MHVCQGACMEVRGQFAGIGSLLPLYEGSVTKLQPLGLIGHLYQLSHLTGPAFLEKKNNNNNQETVFDE